MIITIDSEGVVISLTSLAQCDMTWNQLDDFEKAIEIIRNIQASAHIDSARITVT